MMKILRLYFCLIALLISGMSLEMYAISPDEMPNVQVLRADQYVSDPDGVLSSAVREDVNRELAALRKQTSVEMVVVIPSDLDDMEPQEWCEKLFTKWGIGKSDKDNGVLLMLSPGARKTFIMTGYGVEGVLTDFTCKTIINHAIIPNMRDDDPDAAVYEAVNMITHALEDPAYAEELHSKEADNQSGGFTPISTEVIKKFLKFIAEFMFMVTLGVFIYNVRRVRKLRNYEKAMALRDSLKIFMWLGFMSLGTGLIFWLLTYILYRYTRTKRIKCPTCGTKMNRLGEAEDNELLNDSQDFEEQIKTVDYDVWECPKCGTVERFPFKADQKKYTECPSCHTIAMCLVSDVIVRPATIRREGYGVKTYECQFCHHRDQKPYKIPKKDDGSAALAAGAILGSTLGRGGSGGGGGFGGGGFGGGATGGGGAGGGW